VRSTRVARSAWKKKPRGWRFASSPRAGCSAAKLDQRVPVPRRALGFRALVGLVGSASAYESPKRGEHSTECRKGKEAVGQTLGEAASSARSRMLSASLRIARQEESAWRSGGQNPRRAPTTDHRRRRGPMGFQAAEGSSPAQAFVPIGARFGPRQGWRTHPNCGGAGRYHRV